MNLKITNDRSNNYIAKFQEGGAMPPEAAGAPVPEAGAEMAPEQGGGDLMEQILQAAMQAVQTQDGNLALQVCQAIVEMAGGGAGAPAQAPEGQEPVYRKGGRLIKWVSK